MKPLKSSPERSSGNNDHKIPGLMEDGFPISRTDRHSLLANELHHRTQNTLAVVLALARITARSVDTIEGFQVAFGARIQALARTNSLLLRGHPQSVNVRDALELELEPYLGVGRRLSIDCEPLAVTSDAALSLSLIIHELATNAVKYGGLSSAEGALTIRCERRGEGAALVWSETFPQSAAKLPLMRGAGSVLIERLARDLGGTATLAFKAGALCAVITFRLERVFAVEGGLGFLAGEQASASALASEG